MTHDAHIPSFYILYSIQVCPIEPTRLLVKELREGGKTNIDMVEWEQVCSIKHISICNFGVSTKMKTIYFLFQEGLGHIGISKTPSFPAEIQRFANEVHGKSKL